MKTEKPTVDLDMWLVIDANGEFSVGRTSATAAELYAAQDYDSCEQHSLRLFLTVAPDGTRDTYLIGARKVACGDRQEVCFYVAFDEDGGLGFGGDEQLAREDYTERNGGQACRAFRAIATVPLPKPIELWVDLREEADTDSLAA